MRIKAIYRKNLKMSDNKPKLKQEQKLLRLG